MASRTRHAAALALLALLVIVAASVFAATANVFNASVYALKVDGTDVGYIRSYSGCRPVAEVVTAASTSGASVEKHLADLRYEPCTIVFGAGMGAPLYEWVRDAFDRNAAPKNVVISLADYNFNIISTLELTSASIGAVRMPDLDAASKEASYITVELHPTLVRSGGGGGKATYPSATNAARTWAQSSYSVQMENTTFLPVSMMTGAGLRVVEADEATKSVGRTTIDDVSVTLAASQSSTMSAWAEDLLVKGTGQERTFVVSYLSPVPGKPHFNVTLRGVGVYGGDVLLPGVSNARSDSVVRSTFHLYVEEVEFRQGGSK